MTAPRQILPGQRHLITRRCTQRQFLLRPSRLTNQTVKYCLALAAERTGVLIHAACFMSNHWHGVVTDPGARLPEFLERFHRLVAKAQNAVCLEFVRPAIFPESSDEELSARLREAVATRVQRARKDMQLRGLPFLGRKAVLRQALSATPKTPAPHRNPSPRIASKSTPARIRAIRRMLAFVKEYRVARLSWRAGNRNVTFPAGTYALRIHAGVACAQAP
ncbi:MAG TPA: hypothetical protein VGF76_09525 [Polyangiaceae bacterium]